MNNEIIIKELISTMSDAELKALKRRIEMILAGDLTALGINIDEINILEPMEDYLNDKQICGRTTWSAGTPGTPRALNR